MARSRREVILAAVDDLVANLLFYDRKEDEDLPEGSIEQAIADGEITEEEIADRFKTTLMTAFQVEDRENGSPIQEA